MLNKQALHQGLLVLLICFLAACSSTTALKVNNEITKSPVDRRDYRSLLLPNGLEVLLISDAQAEQAAAALDVSAGSGDDTRAGIAHFLEHMLFLGTEKYPEAGEYQAFISAHGGQHNAYTSYENTNYFFDVEPAYINEALDRFSQFFIAPLFSEEFVEREKHAVDSEYQAKIRNESRRSLDVFRELVHPEHRFSKFSVGSLDTLSGDKLRDDVIAFYRQNYSADRMKLVVLAPLPLDDLQATVTELFSQVPSFKTGRQLSTVPMLAKESLQQWVYFEPLVDKKELTLSFPTPLLRGYESERPLHFISHILGHEGQGSLLHLLKEKGFATALAAGPGLDALDAASMVIQIELTDRGYQNKEQIVEYVFAAIENIRQQGVLARIYEELATTSDLNFNYQQLPSPVSTVSSLANQLHRFDASDVLYANYRMDHFDEDLIHKYLDYLTPQNVLVAVTAKNIQADRSSPWYFTPYRLQPFSEQQLQSWSNPKSMDEFSPPEENRLLPKDLEIQDIVTDKKPRLLKETPWQLWYAADTSFGLPRANVRLNLRSKQANLSARHSALLDLYIATVREQVNVLAYDAYLANMAFSIGSHGRGLSIEVAGFSDKQEVMLGAVAKAMKSPNIAEKNFQAIKQRLIRAWRDNKKQQPYGYLMGEISRGLLHPSWEAEQLADALEPVTLEDVRNFSSDFMDELSLEILVHGNYTQSQAEKLALDFATVLEAEYVEQRPPFQVRKLDEAERYQLVSELPHADSAVAWYWQSPEQGYKARAAFALLAQIVQPRFFDELRTNKQLGYVVFTTNMPMLEVPGVAFVAQSPKVSAAELAAEFEQFLSAQWLELAELPADEFNRNKAALLARLTEKPQRLSQLTDDYWSDIALGHRNFDDREQLVDVLQQLQFDDWLIFVSQAWKQGGQIVFWAPGDKGAKIPLSWKKAASKNKARFYQAY